MCTTKERAKEEEDWFKDNLRYDPDTGHLWWIKENDSSRKRNFDCPAGFNSAGYLMVNITIKGRVTSTIRLHRVAWFLYYGVWPKGQLDHINNIRNDNRIVNLREASASENGGNSTKALKYKGKPTSSKYKGVSWHKRDCMWRSQIFVNGKTIYLGPYHNEEEAALAYNKAALEHFGEFAKINDITP